MIQSQKLMDLENNMDNLVNLNQYKKDYLDFYKK